MNLEKELKKLYNSEINVRIESFWDSSWKVMLGDHINGYQKPDWDVCELNEIAPALRELAKKHYPESKYVKNL